MARKSKTELKELWRRFKEDGDADARSALIEAYLPQARYVAERLKGKLPAAIDIQDMISAGRVGLIGAVDKFDLARGFQFETYCCTRIRGAILDDLRANDWVPRLIRHRAHCLEKARVELSYELGRDATDEETATRMGIGLDEFYALLKEVEVRAQLPIEGAASDDVDDDDVQIIEMIRDPSAEHPLDALARSEFRETITQGLSTKEKRVIDMYYFDRMTMRSIGSILNVSESRVCQIHAQVMKRLRKRLLREEAKELRAA